MRYSTGKHLSGHPPRERGAMLGQFLLIAITIVIGGLLAIAVTRHGEPVATQAPMAPEAPAQPTSPPSTTGAPAKAPAAGVPTPGATEPAGTPAMDGGNLLANPGFEEGLDGWSAIGGARLDLSDGARERAMALSLAPGTGAAPGVTARHVTECQARRSYTAVAWVRASKAGTTAELNLVEYANGRRLSTDTAGVVLPGGSWQRLDVAHVTHRPGSELSVEVVVPGLARQSTVTVDAIEVRLGPKTDAFTPETTP